MKKKILSICMTGLMSILLTGCCLLHEWQEATCESPKTCAKCEKTEGEPLGHEWQEATCMEPETCSICKETRGKKLDHDWQEATCQAPMTCSVCGVIAGNVGDHTWQEATCQTPRTCSVCGLTWGSVGNHVWGRSAFSVVCTLCGKTMDYRNTAVGDMAVGDIVTFGIYPQTADGECEPIEWEVLDVQDGKALLISRYVLDLVETDTSGRCIENPISSSNSWKESPGRIWANGIFYDSAFSEAEKEMILSTEITVGYLDAPFNSYHGRRYYNEAESEDKVFFLSCDEVEKYYGPSVTYDITICHDKVWQEIYGTDVKTSLNQYAYCRAVCPATEYVIQNQHIWKPNLREYDGELSSILVDNSDDFVGAKVTGDIDFNFPEWEIGKCLYDWCVRDHDFSHNIYFITSEGVGKAGAYSLHQHRYAGARPAMWITLQ